MRKQNRISRAHSCVCSLFLLFNFLGLSSVSCADDVQVFRMSSFPYSNESLLRYSDSRRVLVTFKTTPEALRKLVPQPLVPNPDSIAVIYAAEWNAKGHQSVDYNDSGGTFLEVALCIPVRFEKTTGVYAVVLYLDKASRIPMSREIWGFPKKVADIKFTEKDGKVLSTVNINGTNIVILNFERAEKVDPVPVLPRSIVFSLKKIPSIRRNTPPDVMQLTSTQANYKAKEFWKGKATLELSALSTEPTGGIPIVKVVSANYTVLEGTMDHGDVIYNYLSKDKK
jgi:acetoacetate decarboxylase